MRNKLKLNLDELSVDTFDTSARGPGQRGTVRANECCACCCCCPCCCTFGCTAATDCGQATCGVSCYGTCGEYTCQASCNGTCDYSCNGTCNCGGTAYDRTCRNYGSCGYRECADIP